MSLYWLFEFTPSGMPSAKFRLEMLCLSFFPVEVFADGIRILQNFVEIFGVLNFHLPEYFIKNSDQKWCVL
jgi:hypothetical protein